MSVSPSSAPLWIRPYNQGVAGTEVDLGGIVGAVAARARAMTPEFDPGGFLEGLSGQLQGLIPHDRVTVLYLDEGGRTVSVFAEHTSGDAPRHDGRYTLSLARASRYPIAEAVSSCVFAGQAEFVRDAQSDARCMAGAAVRPVLDFDIMATYLLESDGMKRWLLVAEGRPVRADERFEDFSFAARLLAREPVLMRECERELDLVNPTDRTILEDGIRSFIAVPLIFGEKVGGLLAFAKRQPDWFDLSDLEVVEEIADRKS